MTKYTRLPIFILSILMSWSACSNFVEDVDPVLDQILDEKVNNEIQIPFLSDGVKLTFSNTFDNIIVLSDGLSDALDYDPAVGDATFPSYQEIETGDILLDNTSIEPNFRTLGALRFLADDLVRRIEEIGTFDDADLKTQGLFTGYFFGGIARYFYATYYGLSETEGGGVINKGPFIPSNEMYALAIEKFGASLNTLPSDY